MRYLLLAFCISVGFSAVMLCSCGGNEGLTAEELLSRATSVETIDPQQALLTLDSIHECFPRNVKMRRAADTVMWRIELALAMKSLPFVDSVISVKEKMLDVMSVNFVFSKDDLYQDLGVWEHRMFRTELNTSKNYLKPTVKENGEITMTSFYAGREETHDGIVVTVGEYAKKVTDIDGGTSFTDLGVFHEFLSITETTEDGLTKFIAEMEGENATVSLLAAGDEKLKYSVSSRDVKAIRETYLFALEVSDLWNLKRDREKFKMQIERYSNK
ncbi:MAG: hypothetical protein MJZ93_02765 [Paludibacteraceae bacterium]|nr:hypothetical protein [Paludibacteraceae bacterium]